MPYKDPVKQKEYNKQYYKEYYQRNKDKYNTPELRTKRREYFHDPEKKEALKQYRKENLDKFLNRHYESKYGITLEDYNNLLREQNNCCAICDIHESENKKSLAVDHNHTTGKVRALLCANCNVSLGLLKEDIDRLQKMMDYIKKHND